MLDEGYSRLHKRLKINYNKTKMIKLPSEKIIIEDTLPSKLLRNASILTMR